MQTILMKIKLENHINLPDFPFQQFHPHGETYEEAAKHGQEVYRKFD